MDKLDNINLEKIEELIKGHKPLPVDIKSRYSVLIPLILVDGEIHVLFERRADSLRTQPGEVSFPGGKIEAFEEEKEAAIRETCEELLIEKNKIKIFAQGNFLVNPNREIIYTFIGLIDEEFYKIKANKDEVSYIFTVPLSFFLENSPDAYKTSIKITKEPDFPYDLIPNGENYKFKRYGEIVELYHYKEEIIWGFTAKMIRNFTDIISQKFTKI
ncbi:CoA pyrophosphatase [Peptoniphilus sp. BV3C26]|uniref:NUDIX hydrolase n=1 Tax=Peptoniphilus sp. BV3C26 TaxID=1111134 RepID=UPI0003B7ED3D|nr:CoA pyrophosphatase [Peptoniphilus sp. BV3C26]ERT57385.1 NUDIX domain protein [Peptoniphilus sp. BV3C26]